MSSRSLLIELGQIALFLVDGQNGNLIAVSSAYKLVVHSVTAGCKIMAETVFGSDYYVAQCYARSVLHVLCFDKNAS